MQKKSEESVCEAHVLVPCEQMCHASMDTDVNPGTYSPNVRMCAQQWSRAAGISKS